MNERFGIGKVLGTGFRVWAKNFVPFMLITTLIFSPVLIWGVSVVSGQITLRSIENFARYGGLLEVMLGVLASAALTYGVVMELQGQRASIGGCITVGIARFFPALAVCILTVLLFFLGLIALVIPGIIVFCMLYVSTQASVIERPGITGALARSRALTENHRLEIFGLLVVLWILSFGGQKLIENVVLKAPGDIPAFMYATLAFAVVIGSLNSVMAAVAYFYLRQEKEGTSAAELAKVFE